MRNRCINVFLKPTLRTKRKSNGNYVRPPQPPNQQTQGALANEAGKVLVDENGNAILIE